MKPVCPEEIVVYAGGEQNYSREYRCHDQLVAQRFYIYYTQLLHVSAIYPGHLQGVKSSVDVFTAQIKEREFSLNDF